jgi:hypothetical protein
MLQHVCPISPDTSRLQVSLVEGRRVGGKVRHEHIASLGSVPIPAAAADRIAFWGLAGDRLERLANRIGNEKEKIVSAIHARIPLFDGEDIRSVQRENAEADEKLWTTLHSGDAEMAEALKEQADKAGARAKISGEMVAAAKDRIARIAKGEIVSGGLGKPMTLKGYEKILRDAGWTAADIRFSKEMNHSLRSEEEFEDFVRQSCEMMHRAEKSSRWKILRQIRAKRGRGP